MVGPTPIAAAASPNAILTSPLGSPTGPVAKSLAGIDVTNIKSVVLLLVLPSELSAGEKQRVVIARALATNPLLLLADEPTGNLDAEASEEIFQLFWRLHLEGMAVVMATHNTELVRRTPGVRVLELKNGQLISDSVVGTEPVSSVRETDVLGSPPASGPQTSMLSESNKTSVTEVPKGSPPDVPHEGAPNQRENT